MTLLLFPKLTQTLFQIFNAGNFKADCILMTCLLLSRRRFLGSTSRKNFINKIHFEINLGFDLSCPFSSLHLELVLFFFLLKFLSNKSSFSYGDIVLFETSFFFVNLFSDIVWHRYFVNLKSSIFRLSKPPSFNSFF